MKRFMVVSLVFIFGCYSNDVNNKSCMCVPYYQCSEDSENLIVDGLGLVDIRGYQKNTCKGYFDVCCDATKSLIGTTTEQHTVFKGCGYESIEKHPWTGILSFQEDISTPPVKRCGVSFIHKQVGLTAAHCLNKKGIWTVVTGDITINVKKLILHPSYNSGTLHNDIALLVLDEAIILINNIGLICIPPPSMLLDNTRCTVRTNSGNIATSSAKLIDIPIIPKERCLQLLRTTRLGVFFQLHYSFICAGGESNKDTCGGDGGSPLVCPIFGQLGRYHQAGIVSWGIGCGQNNLPGVYVNVAAFREWIDQKMIENGFDIFSYRY